jgi:hypothetical protein
VCLRPTMPSMMPCLLCVVLLAGVAYAGNESVSIYPPAAPIRGPMGVVGYEVTGDVDSCGIQCERLWITGKGQGGNTYFDHVSFDPPDPNYGYRMFIYPPEDVDQGGSPSP